MSRVPRGERGRGALVGTHAVGMPDLRGEGRRVGSPIGTGALSHGAGESLTRRVGARQASQVAGPTGGARHEEAQTSTSRRRLVVIVTTCHDKKYDRKDTTPHRGHPFLHDVSTTGSARQSNHAAQGGMVDENRKNRWVALTQRIENSCGPCVRIRSRLRLPPATLSRSRWLD
jgi:hypothetical protein